MTVDGPRPAPTGTLGEARAGAWDVAPLAFGVAIYGLAFGLLAAQSGFGTAGVGAMDVAVFAGGSQIVATQRLAAGAGAATAAVAGLALNLRLLLVTASISDVFAGRPWWQVALGAHLATDENWALLLAQRARGRNVGYPYLVGAGVCLGAVWCASTVAGVAFARALPDPAVFGMDFAFTAAFIAIARSLWTGERDLLPWAVAAGTVLASVRLAGLEPSWAIVVGGVAGAGAAAGLDRHG